jgi:hypothetical protein
MQFKNIVAVIASLGLVQAFKFTAEEVQDGIYAIKTDASGKEYMEYLEPGNTTQPTTWNQRRNVHPKLMARDTSDVSQHSKFIQIFISPISRALAVPSHFLRTKLIG